MKLAERVIRRGFLFAFLFFVFHFHPFCGQTQMVSGIRQSAPSAAHFLFLACVALVALGDMCGSWCGTNNNCAPSLHCSRCDESIDTCVQGEPCGASCNVTTDCNQASNCTQCVLGVCVAGCGQPCNVTKDCEGFGCNECMYGVCVLWQCNRFCTSDSPCQVGGYPGCGTCDHSSPTGRGSCLSTCGGMCNDGGQCPGRCPFCIGGQCSVTRDP
jgi:hypothetical protein